MAFSTFPYLIICAGHTDLGITANLPVIGSQLTLQPYNNNFQALWNVDFDNGLIALAMTGNSLVMHAPDLSAGTALALKPVESLDDTQWEISANPGLILARKDNNLAVANQGGGGQNTSICIEALNAPALEQKWMLVQLTALTSSTFRTVRAA